MGRVSVRVSDLTPLLVCVTDDELREIADYLGERDEPLPLPLAKMTLALEYLVARREQQRTRTYDLTVNWTAEKQKRPRWWRS